MSANQQECPLPCPLPDKGEREVSLGGGEMVNSQPPRPPRLPVATVQHIERLVGGDPVTEGEILRFIAARYGAKNLFYLPPQIAAAVCKRPADFIRAGKQYCQPELAL